MSIPFKPSPVMLVVTQDRILAGELLEELEPQGYQLEWTEHGGQALEMSTRLQARYIILDWRLTTPDVQQLCRHIRQGTTESGVYLIALCGRNHARDRVQALEAGVNDYLTEPFNAQELLASMEALRRPRVIIPFLRELKAGEINMALDSWEVYVSGKAVELTHKEFRLLEELLNEKGRVLSREVLLARIWRHTNVDKLHTRTVDIHMSRLRRKLGYAGTNIITVRNIGYRIDVVPEWITHVHSPRKTS